MSMQEHGRDHAGALSAGIDETVQVLPDGESCAGRQGERQLTRNEASAHTDCASGSTAPAPWMASHTSDVSAISTRVIYGVRWVWFSSR